MSMLLEKLEKIEKRFVELEEKLTHPEIFGNQTEYQKITKEVSELREVVETFRTYQKNTQEIKDTETLLTEEKDPSLRELAQEELNMLTAQEANLYQQLETLLLPKDPLADRNIYLEIRAGTGGEEAALFAGDLFRMYSRYAEKERWKVELIDENPTGLGGYKEVICLISGKNVYQRMKFESGTHRVQRVPATEAGGRIHTSAATVAILPEAAEVDDVPIEAKDLRIDTYRASGAGGQHVNKTSSAIRVTHLPTGIAVACQSERSQHQNRAQAMKLLRTRLLDQAVQSQQNAISESRKSQVGSGDRSERIRTYNFPQGRITDHRIGRTQHNLTTFLEGDLDDMIQALLTADQAAKMSQ